MNLESGPAVALAEGCVFSLLLIFALSDLWLARKCEKNNLAIIRHTFGASSRRAVM
jgi:hypothetical protein